MKILRKRGLDSEATAKKFEAGTPALADIIALGSSLDDLKPIGMEPILRFEQELIPQEVKQFLDQQHGVAVRAGNLTAQPLMKR